jgi:hypothetical protein
MFRRSAVVVSPLNVVVHRQNAAMPQHRLNVGLVHQRTADAAHVRYRARRHVSSRVTIDVRQRHRQNVRRVQRSSDHRRSGSRDPCLVLNDRLHDLHRESNDQRRDPRSELNDLRRRRESSGHGHSRADRRRSPTDRKRNHA